VSGLYVVINCDKKAKRMLCFGKTYFSETLKYSRKNRIERMSGNEEELHVECFKVSLLAIRMPYSRIKCLRFGLRL